MKLTPVNLNYKCVILPYFLDTRIGLNLSLVFSGLRFQKFIYIYKSFLQAHKCRLILPKCFLVVCNTKKNYLIRCLVIFNSQSCKILHTKFSNSFFLYFSFRIIRSQIQKKHKGQKNHKAIKLSSRTTVTTKRDFLAWPEISVTE